ncbi:MAG TPA: FAD-binding oxidoreductase [Candidatus Acidoferrales bacterium]|nr:FAD-binding oxidoreductase [Candidatus Acidoferrales bacterium]
MRRKAHRNVTIRKPRPWGAPPWTVDFRPAPRALPDHVDFAIVGGGFTGLSAAAWLRRFAPGRSVLVLESASLGNGASGRTGGMALAETAAGTLPGLGDVLLGYKKILRALRIDSRLTLPGVWELSRSAPATKGCGPVGKPSPISWSDSGELKVVRRVPGGTVDPGKVLAGLARAAEIAGAQIVEHAEVRALDFSNPLRLRVRRKLRGHIHHKEIRADQVLLATNAFSLELSGLRAATVPKLTFALATAPLSAAQLQAIGLGSRRPFYTVDLPYLWGRLLDSNGVIFGAGLVPPYMGTPSRFPIGARSIKNRAYSLRRYDVRKGQAAARLRWLESRVRHLHPALANVRITHRWGGPILLTEKMRPIFRRHPRSKNVMLLAGYNGHGVALSVYLGKWAAEALLNRRPLPRWPLPG